MKLVSKISIALGVIASGAIVTVGWAAFIFTKAQMQNAIGLNQMEIARQTLDKLDRSLYERYNDIQAIAQDQGFLEMLKNPSAPKLLRLQQRIDQLTVLTGPWDFLGLSTNKGILVASNSTRKTGQRLSHEDQVVFEEALQNHVAYSDLKLPPEVISPTIIYACPVRDKNKTGNPIIGVVLGHFAWPVALEILDDAETGAILLNKEGRMIGQNTQLNEEGSRPDLLGKPYPNLFLTNRAKTGQFKSQIYSGDSGEEFLGSAAPQLGYLAYKGSGWNLILVLPAKKAFVGVRQAAIKNALFFIPLILIVSGVVLMGIIRLVVKPIAYLTEATKTIAAGNLSKQVMITSGDEIGQLASSFNTMTARLKESHEGLEDKVRERTEKISLLSGAIEQTANPIIITRADGIIEYVNPAFGKLMGYSLDEVIGQTPRILKSGRHNEEFYKELWATILSGGVFQTVFTNKKKNGELIFVESTITPIKNIKGETKHFIATEKDVTERIKMEKTVLQSEKMSAVGQLAAGVAHEINNPLGIILGFAQASVRRLQENDPLELPLKSIEKEAQRCKNLVQDLLTFSRVSKIEREPTDLNKAVESALSLVMTRAKMAGIAIKVELAHDLSRILGNANQIQQVVINLANNGLDATEKGGTVTVKTEALNEGPLAWACLRIIDTGAGIPTEIKNRIFEPFFTTKGIGKGTGLGLSMVHEIIKKHSGTIEVQSRPGCTEFLVKLPARAVAKTGVIA